ncbi:hypothetical protein LJR175_007779 [Variovorax sp. LjRoot175]|uniref:hypothetical protein n=1 Tax=Variovorax sp. LjRoot175 TaxID=3342276 RepID=UPI003ECFCBD5
MIFEKLHLAGGDSRGYELGEPMLVHDRDRFLGSLDPVEVSPDRSEVRIARFLPSPRLGSERRKFGPLLLVEVTMFLAEHFPSIQNVHFALTREIEMDGDGMMIAAARIELLRSIGAAEAHARPQPDSGRPGNFVVEGVWSYTAHNLGALRSALSIQRELYGNHLACIPKAERPVPLLRRLKQWWVRGRGM